MEKLTALPEQNLPQALLDAFNSGIHVFKVYEINEGKIVDFELVMMSKNSAILPNRMCCG
jgi:hypothetical protein